MNNQIYILYHGSFGELVTGHLAMSGLADRIVGLYDLKVASVSLDDPESDMPEDIPLSACDLLLVLGILPKAGDLVPIIVKYSIEDELKKDGIDVEFPEPLCTLDTSENDIVNSFAVHFGMPKFELRVNAKNMIIEEVKVIRDTPCGTASKIGPKIVGMSYKDMKSLEDKVMQMHDNECVAYMGPDRPIMQQAGRLLADAIKEGLP